jgi:hypothetical protein
MTRWLAVIVLSSISVSAAASRPRRPLLPEVCAAEHRPSLTSLAIPEPVRLSARRAELVERSRTSRARAGAPPAKWLVVVAVVAASAAIASRWR